MVFLRSRSSHASSCQRMPVWSSAPCAGGVTLALGRRSAAVCRGHRVQGIGLPGAAAHQLLVALPQRADIRAARRVPQSSGPRRGALVCLGDDLVGQAALHGLLGAHPAFFVHQAAQFLPAALAAASQLVGVEDTFLSRLQHLRRLPQRRRIAPGRARGVVDHHLAHRAHAPHRAALQDGTGRAGGVALYLGHHPAATLPQQAVDLEARHHHAAAAVDLQHQLLALRKILQSPPDVRWGGALQLAPVIEPLVVAHHDLAVDLHSHAPLPPFPEFLLMLSSRHTDRGT